MAPAKTTAPPMGLVGRYRLRGIRGEGGMGVVYRAFDPDLQREVALKQLRTDRFSGPEARHRLIREARAASRLSHPNIVPIFDVLEHEDTPWIVMEFVEGQDLRALLRTRGALATEDVLRYSTDLAEALAAAHARRVLHRDVNPRNVLIGSDRHARLTDFGLACVYVPPEDESRVSTLSEAGAGRRDARLHLPRTDPRAWGRSAQRPLLPRSRDLRNVHRPPRVHGLGGRKHHRRHTAPRAAADP